MLTMTFGTLEYVNRLKAAQVPDAQAQAQAQAQALQKALQQAGEKTLTQVQTRTDSQFSLLHGGMELLRKDMDMVRKEMELMRKDIIVKLGTMIAASTGVMAAAVKLF